MGYNNIQPQIIVDGSMSELYFKEIILRWIYSNNIEAGIKGDSLTGKSQSVEIPLKKNELKF